MSFLDQMIALAKSFSSELSVTKDVNDKILVSIRYVSWKENRNDCMARSITGRGVDIHQACKDFLEKAGGKILFGDSITHYGENPPQYICLTLAQ